jgi:hypothetical protein
MRSINVLVTTILSLILISGCSKEEVQRYSGTDSIDNLILGETVYYAIGFSFDKGELVPTHKTAQPDITVHVDTNIAGQFIAPWLDTPTLTPPFFLSGEFDSEQLAKSHFDNLKEVVSPVWVSNANPLKVGQVWIIRTNGFNYAKFRVISLDLEIREGRPYVKMRFEWVVQPNGTPYF